MSKVAFCVFISVYTAIGTAGMLLMRAGFVEANVDRTQGILVLVDTLVRNFKLTVGIGCYVASFALFLFLLANKTITFGLPVAIGSSYVAAVVGANLILGERVASMQWVGIVLIGVGLCVTLAYGPTN